MTTTTAPAPLPFRRCPICAAVHWQGWQISHRHRPPCPNTDTHPDNWTTHD
jgi:hypothetical protein